MSFLQTGKHPVYTREPNWRKQRASAQHEPLPPMRVECSPRGMRRGSPAPLAQRPLASTESIKGRRRTAREPFSSLGKEKNRGARWRGRNRKPRRGRGRRRAEGRGGGGRRHLRPWPERKRGGRQTKRARGPLHESQIQSWQVGVAIRGLV